MHRATGIYADTLDNTNHLLYRIYMDVKTIRQALGMTQERLAQKLGVSFVTISRWELGKSKPSPMAIQKLDKLEKSLPKAAA